MIDTGDDPYRCLVKMLGQVLDGGVLAGIVSDQDAGQVTLALSPEKSVRVERGNIRNLEPLHVSLMPAGMNTILTQQQLADLIAYLEASR